MSMFSPPRREKARSNSSHLPNGDCRYILLHPENKGLRCACMGFALNGSIPGSICDCGHQACFHAQEKEKETGVGDRQELEALKAKVEMLERERIERDQDREKERALVERLSRLEELVDQNKGEADAEYKNVYRGIGGIWHHVGALTKRTTGHDDNIEGLADDVEGLRSRLIDIDHAAIQVEERVEIVETTLHSLSSPLPIISRRRKASTPPSEDRTEDRSQATPTNNRASSYHDHDDSSSVQSFRERVSSVGADPRAWTVHISLLPTYRQPFPFEKDTAAYKRCLSRGLHQMIVIPDSNSVSFKQAVGDAFSKVLLGRCWEPLVARICDAKNLRGLPMLRRLEAHLLEKDHDMEFLQENCAVVDDYGKILDLYIAMSEDTISWAELREVDAFTPGLEAAWTYDPFLDIESDGPSMTGQPLDASKKGPAAGDIVTTWSPSLKRSASEISRTPSRLMVLLQMLD
ncbi:hypothetical protein BJ875DRAFT_221063 [Amylocarpus encephaloides]|uniref:Uncharacterized protein n=1 Tax=Amylocarpus encephaloides TaxID=45428 RepID=A0A9P7YSP3_9HELO|nr:hypothetical protein BJ875DRAFT_221063 [Amylocarpus encephaloides]